LKNNLILSISKNNNVLKWVLLLLSGFIWGSSFILMKKGLQAFSSPQVASLRIFITFVIFMPFFYSFLKKINFKDFIFITLVGLFGNGIPYYLFTYAQQHINSSTAGILNSLTPIATMIFAIIIFKFKIKIYNIIGLFIGLIGAFIIIKSGNSDFSFQGNIYGIFIILATFCYGLSTNIARYKLMNVNSVVTTGLVFFLMGPIAGIHLYSTNIVDTIQSSEIAQEAFGYMLILSVFGTALSLIFYYYLVKISSSIFASTVTYIIPVFAIIWGVLDGEKLTFYHIIGIVVIFCGVILVNYRKKPQENIS